MEFAKETIAKILAILDEEIVPAEGCTEPIALAYVAAKAREVLGCAPETMKIYVSGNIVKNVKSVVVPKSGGRVGIEVSAAMGAIAGRPEKQLMVIQDVTPEALAKVVAFLEVGEIAVQLEPTDIKLYIRVELSGG